MKPITSISLGILMLPLTILAEPNTTTQGGSQKKLIIPEYTKSATISSRFDKIVYNNYVTFLPKGTILYLPKNHKSKLNASVAKKKLQRLSWHDFYMKNRNMIHVVKLNSEQAFGKKSGKRYEMPYEKLEGLKKLGCIIICTYNDSPVRVKIQPKPEK